MSYYRTLIMATTEESIMSVKLQPNMTQNARDLRICEDYWAYDNESDYIAHIETVCEKYKISPQVLFETINEPPRLYRRLIYLSQAAMPDRVKLS